MSIDSHRTTTPWLPVLALMLLGAALRILRIEAQPLSGDEAYSVVVWIQTPLGYLLRTIALAMTEPHPPLALVALHGWAQLAGDSVLSVRMFAVLASLVAMAATYQIGWRLAGHRAAVIALSIAAISPFHIWYGQFARNYSLWMAGSALSVIFLLYGWQHPERVRRWIPYVITAILTGYVFYLEVFHYAAHNLYALIRVWKRQDWVRYWVLTQVVIAAALAPWYLRPELFANSQNYEPNGEPANPLWGLQSLLVGNTLPAWLQHPQVNDPAHSVGIASVVVLIILAASLAVIWRTASRSTFWFLLFTGLGPISLLSLLSMITGRHYFHPRYISASATSIILIAALGIDGMLRLDSVTPYTRRVLAGTVTGMIVVLSAIGIWNYQFNPIFAKGPDWISVMRVLSQETTTRDLVVMNYPDPAFSYYYQHEYRGPVEQPEYMPLNANEPYEEVARQMDALTLEADSVWFIPVVIPWWDGDQQVARWLQEEKQYVSDRWIGVTRLYQYANWQADESEIAVPTRHEFEEVAVLQGYRLTPQADQWEPGSTVHIELFWLPSQQTSVDLKVFVHLIGPAKPDGSPIWAQEDKFPQHGRAMTTAWKPGILLRDVYHLALPLDMPPGDYTVSVGFYDPTTSARVALTAPLRSDAASLLSIRLP